jgi:beta-lactamase regulating signal transducer with metallopeptidase domain
VIDVTHALFMVPEPIPAIGVCLKVTAVLSLAWGVSMHMRWRSAAARHLVWTLALGGSVALAALTPVVPRVPVYVPVFRASPAAVWLGLQIVSTVWLVGALSVAVWLASGHVALARIVRRARMTTRVSPWLDRALERERVDGHRVLVSEAVRVPLTWGLARPVVLMPACAAAWPARRLRAALRHECAHIARRDCVVQALASGACVLFWFHPLVWLAVRHLRAESERACDDRVLASGLAAPDYAGHLLAVARERWRVPAALAAAGMARGWEFETRIVALLDDRRPRTALGLRGGLGIVLVAVTLLAPLSLLRLRIAQPWAAPVHSAAVGTTRR